MHSRLTAWTGLQWRNDYSHSMPIAVPAVISKIADLGQSSTEVSMMLPNVRVPLPAKTGRSRRRQEAAETSRGVHSRAIPLPLARGQAPLAQVDRELVRGAHSVLEHRVVDVDTADLVRVRRQPVPDVLDPEDGEPGLVGEPAPQIVKVSQMEARR